MDAILFIECVETKENFDYDRQLSQEEYIQMLRQASDSILGHDGFSKRSSLERRYGMMDMQELEKYQKNDDIIELPFKVKLYNTDNSEMSIADIGKVYNSGGMSIFIVEYDDIESPFVEDTLNIWITNSDHINNDPTLNNELILKSLERKNMSLKVNNHYLKLCGCQMVDKISPNKFAMLIHKIEK